MNEERVLRLLESTNAIPWEADAKNWRFTYVGPQAVRLLGYSWDQWYEDGFWSAHIHEEDREAALSFCMASSAAHDNYEFEYRMIASDGKAIWIHDLVSVIRDRGGPRLLQGFMIDITERKQSEQAVRTLNQELEQRVEERTQELRKSEAPFEQLLTRSPAVIYRCKTGGDYGANFVSENAKQLSGYEARELVDDPALWGSRIHPEDLIHAVIGRDGLFEQGRPAVEYRVRHKNGAFRWVHDE